MLPVREAQSRAFLFSPASWYPTPAAYVVDGSGALLHRWTNAAHQPRPEEGPPSNHRGWNHVAANADGSLYAIVPLSALLKINVGSELEWCCEIPAHHDLAIDDSGAVLVLTERPRLVMLDGVPQVILDNAVTKLDTDGTVLTEVSLYDVLRTDPGLRGLIDSSARRRVEHFRRRGWPTPGDDVSRGVVDETMGILRTGTYVGDMRQALRRLRALPGSPCDVLHTNTLKLVDAHWSGMWKRGDVIVCMREINTVAVIDLDCRAVKWWWGADVLSGPHQPSVLADGRVLVFDNGIELRRTRLVIVDPTTAEIVWSWSADPPESFFCPLAGGCEPLESGNILVTNSRAGEAFEVNMQGRIVWQLTLPIEVYGADRKRVSIYRMSALRPEIVTKLLQHHALRERAAWSSTTG